MELVENNKFNCRRCKEYSQLLKQGDNHRFLWVKKCNKFDCCLSLARKRCQGKHFNGISTVKKNMKIVKMIAWKDSNNYPLCSDQNNFKNFWDYVKKFLFDRNIKYNGSWHQNWDYGVPLIENEGKLYAFAISMRRWGQLIAEAFDKENKDPFVYLDWAFSNPKGGHNTVDENKDPLKN